MATKYMQGFPIPEAFPEILHDFAREVLRDQPEDILAYAAKYFECLEQVRESKIKSLQKSLWAKELYFREAKAKINNFK